MGIREDGDDVAAIQGKTEWEYATALVLALFDEVVWVTLRVDVANALEGDLAASWNVPCPLDVSHVSDYQIAVYVIHEQTCPAETKVLPVEVPYSVTHEGAMRLKNLGNVLGIVLGALQCHPSPLETAQLSLAKVVSDPSLASLAPLIQLLAPWCSHSLESCSQLGLDHAEVAKQHHHYPARHSSWQ
jgi:hypothetical protein